MQTNAETECDHERPEPGAAHAFSDIAGLTSLGSDESSIWRVQESKERDDDSCVTQPFPVARCSDSDTESDAPPPNPVPSDAPEHAEDGVGD